MDSQHDSMDAPDATLWPSSETNIFGIRLADHPIPMPGVIRNLCAADKAFMRGDYEGVLVAEDKVLDDWRSIGIEMLKEPVKEMERARRRFANELLILEAKLSPGCAFAAMERKMIALRHCFDALVSFHFTAEVFLAKLCSETSEIYDYCWEYGRHDLARRIEGESDDVSPQQSVISETALSSQNSGADEPSATPIQELTTSSQPPKTPTKNAPLLEEPVVHKEPIANSKSLASATPPSPLFHKSILIYGKFSSRIRAIPNSGTEDDDYAPFSSGRYADHPDNLYYRNVDRDNSGCLESANAEV
ncbi:hypothetical protein F4604DRAFT_1918639 [Suillus subluteus]|nr:hypothetical protein F4604DRAFT_1918639 [Suillus subluteus]